MIYFDNNATTKTHPLVIDRMFEVMQLPLNSSSIHSFGRNAKMILSDSKNSIYSMLGIKNNMDYRMVFTSSGTEANNLLMFNFADADIFISSIEHSSIYKHYEQKSNVILINVDKNGIIDIEDLTNKLQASKANKKLVSIMMANHETGVIQDLNKIIKAIRPYGCFIHSDLVQSVGKMKINFSDIDLDFATISAHKFGGPCGIGALISKISHNLSPMIIGGGQQENIRSGTENIAAIAGFGKAALILMEEESERIAKMKNMQNNLEKIIKIKLPNVHIVAENAERIPNTTTLISHGNKNSDAQLIALDLKGIAVSSGSACSSGSVKKSNVLLAMGYSDYEIDRAIRVSNSYTNTDEEIENFVNSYLEINS